MKPPLNSTKPGRLAQGLGIGLIALVFYAMLAAMVLAASFVLLQRGITPQLPWIAAVQEHLYMKAMRSIWQNKADCVDFDEELIYKPKLGACQFSNVEFDTTLNFSAEGRSTGPKPAGLGIAVIGDSHAMGWGVQDEETFSAILQQLSKRPVFNLGVASYGTARELIRLKRSGILDKVDTIILQYCGDDLKENLSRLNNTITKEESHKRFDRVTRGRMTHGRLLRTVLKAYGRTFMYPFNPQKASSNEHETDFSSHYRALMAVLATHPELEEKRILVFYSNGHGQPFQNFPNGLDKKMQNVEFISLDIPADDYYRLDDHMTPKGHSNLARRLLAAIKQNPPAAKLQR